MKSWVSGRHGHVLLVKRGIHAGNVGRGVVEPGLMIDQVPYRHHRIDGRQFERARRWPAFPLHFAETPSIGGDCDLHVREFGNVIGDRIFEIEDTVFHQVEDRRDGDDLAHGPDADPRLPVDIGVRQETPINCAVLVDDVTIGDLQVARK